ncbi:MAG: hypothetical protein ACTS4V_00110 [Candidatus Hodgkinia cicadicola]
MLLRRRFGTNITNQIQLIVKTLSGHFNVSGVTLYCESVFVNDNAIVQINASSLN